MYKSIPLNFMFFKAPLLKRILGYVGIIYIDYRTDEKRPIYYGDRILTLKYNIPIKFEDICMYNDENAYDILFGYIKKENMSVFQLAMSERRHRMKRCDAAFIPSGRLRMTGCGGCRNIE